jgi:pyridoxamine 5'-phosphate oxidase
MDLSDRRAEYAKNSLNASDLAVTPFEQFEHWFTEAESCAIEEPNAFCLATCDLQGQPSTRIVLLKEFSTKGLVFYTNYESRKGIEFKNNPRVAANFLWLPLQRQVNIIGRIEQLSEADSLRYFASRPQSSQLGAWTSPQSQVIASRKVLETRHEQMEKYPYRIIGVVVVSCQIALNFGKAVQVVCMTGFAIGRTLKGFGKLRV